MQDGIFVAAPPGRPWQVSLDDVESWLRERWPEGTFRRDHESLTVADTLDFDVTLDGLFLHGYLFDRSHLILHNGPPEFWAEFIAWFLDRLPAGSGAVGMLEAVPEPAPLPAEPTPQGIAEFFALPRRNTPGCAGRHNPGYAR